jgi:hypothetical protein
VVRSSGVSFRTREGGADNLHNLLSAAASRAGGRLQVCRRNRKWRSIRTNTFDFGDIVIVVDGGSRGPGR